MSRQQIQLITKEVIYLSSKQYSLIYKPTNLVLGWSDELQNLVQYTVQFNLVHDIEIMEISEYDKARYSDRLEIVQYRFDLVLTIMEIEYYDKSVFRPMYDDMKTTITNLLLYIKVSNVSGEDKTKIKDTIKSLYQRSETYEKFLNSLDRDTIMTAYIHNPVQSRNMIKLYMDMEYQYKYKMNTD